MDELRFGSRIKIMNLYLVRHSKAEVSHSRGDSFRKLSERGWQRLADVANQVKTMDWKPGLRITSPYLRARETAEGFSKILDFGTFALEPSSLFTPEGDPQEALTEIQGWVNRGFDSIWVFTHNPFVTDFARLLVAPSSYDRLNFHTPTVLALKFSHDLQPHGGEILWLVHPGEFD